MFGYIKPLKPQLRLWEYDAYKAVYCGLCGQLGKSFGPAARITLSYDFTFLCMLHYAVSGHQPAFSRHRCHVNPLKKLPMCAGDEVLAFGADVAIIMLYYKLCDNIKDQKGLKRLQWKLLRPFARGLYKKAAARQPQCDEIIAKSMEQQAALEAEHTANADAASEPTAQAMAAICRLLCEDAAQQRVLERLGYCVGRFVYLCDALDDLEEDLLAGGYNPYALRYAVTPDSPAQELEMVHARAKESLFGSIAEAAKAYELLEVKEFGPILENILFMGMQASVNEILSKKEKMR